MHVQRGPARPAASPPLVIRGLVGLALCVVCRVAQAQGMAEGAIHRFAAGPARVVATDTETGQIHTCAVRNGDREAGAGCTLANLAPGTYRVAVDGAPEVLVDVTAGETAEAEIKPPAISPPVTLPPEALPPDEDEDGLLSVRGLAPNQAATVLDGVSSAQALGGVPLGRGSDAAANPDDDADAAETTNGPAHGLGRGRRAGIGFGFAGASVREFRLGADNYSAQAGGTGGALILTTRAGGDTLHGSFAFNLRSSLLAAFDPLAIATSYAAGVVTSTPVKPHDLRVNGGGSAGGPIPHLALWHYFAAVEVQRRGFPAVSSPAEPGFYSLTPIQRALLGTRGVPSAQIDQALTYLSSLTGLTDRRADQQVEFGRLDWHLHPRFALGAEYNRVRLTSPAGLLASPVVARGRASLGNADASVDQLLVRLSSSLSRNAANQATLAYAHDLQHETPQTPLAAEQAIGPGGTAPEVNIGPNGLLFGTPAGLSQLAYPDERRLEARDVLTLPRRQHLIQLGGTIDRVTERAATLGNVAGTFHYDSGETRGYAGGLVDWITDETFNVQTNPNGACPSIAAPDHLFCFRSFTQSFGPATAEFATVSVAAFVEDTWHPAPRLSLHVGLRYERTQLPPPQHANPALDAIFGQAAATGSFPQDRNNLAPRLSAAFEPFGRGKGLVKLGYGFFFGRMPGATLRAALTETGEPGATAKLRLRPSAIVACPQQPANGFGYLCSFTAQPTGVAIAGASSAVVFARSFRLPVVQQGSLTLEREITARLTASLGYVVNQDRQLPTSTDLNIAPSLATRRYQLHGGDGRIGVRDGETFLLPAYTARVTSAFGPVTELVSHVNATYHGLVARLAARPGPGLALAATYTWSKAIDFGQAESATPRTDAQLDPFANGYDKGLSSLNYPQAFHSALSWAPRFEGAGFRRIANGWTVAAFTTARSGRPYSYDLSGGTRLSGGHTSLNGSGGALYLPTVGRNTLRLPPHLETDLRLQREFAAGGKARLQARVDAFNLFNQQAVTSVNQRAYLVGTAVGGVTPLVFQDAAAIAAEGLNTTPFGTRTGTGSSLNRARQVELSLRITF